MLMNEFADARKPYTLQRAHWIGLLLLGCGWFAISLTTTFPQFLLGTFLRTNGSGICWVYSSLILQTLCDPRFLGRVLALENTLTTLLEAATSYTAGELSTSVGLTDNQLALVGAVMGLLTVVVWGIGYSLSLGAAHPRFNSYEKVNLVQPPTTDTNNSTKSIGAETTTISKNNPTT